MSVSVAFQEIFIVSHLYEEQWKGPHLFSHLLHRFPFLLAEDHIKIRINVIKQLVMLMNIKLPIIFKKHYLSDYTANFLK